MNYTEYKAFHESFMRNNHGSNAAHTFLCIFFTVQCTLLCAIQESNREDLKHLYEYIIIGLPLILVHTVLTEYICSLNAILAIILLYSFINNRKLINFGNFFKIEHTDCKRLHSISCIRGLTYLITSLCILAVDFKDFPRYLAKTERYGYSLMDTGVGLFVLISGLVHKDLNGNFSKVAKSNFKFVSILLVLGISRYVSIKQLDYHEHVTEYGVHWNFFITLAVCKFLSTIFLLISNQILVLSISVMVVHEFMLYNSLEAWVFSNAPRITLIDANREGISSTLGYVSLYLFAVHLKKMLMHRNRKDVLQNLVIYSIVFITLSFVVNLFRPTSRTLANTGYCAYLISILLVILTIMYLIEFSLYNGHKMVFQTPLMLSAINNNGLLYFLICNLLTGFVNIIFQTMLLPSSVTFVILNIYMIFTLYIILCLNRRGIKI
ncbi:phosphatidylinositol-glycan biosynthesis class W protein-like [Zerene cesonia]|uniref:phosphatidylinositol-glycan biosynthesis class W protein-like n=1 Tax=Zerene cesonia TaxID=33412 RepID=UPI0018E515E4|nr:phosphatidylinositol-glycan biosynthesis class W protein-like [Zerene cesonia]